MDKYKNVIDGVKQLFEDRGELVNLLSEEERARDRIREILERDILGECGYMVVFNTSSKSCTDRALDELARLRLRYKSKRDFHCICECYDATLTETGWEVWENNGMIKMCHYRDDKSALPDGYTQFEADRCPICGAVICFGLDSKFSGNITNGMRKV